MPALTPISPEIFRLILERHGCRMTRETPHNWIFIKDDIPNPIINLSRESDLIPLDIMMGILHQLKMDNKTYFDLLNVIQN